MMVLLLALALTGCGGKKTASAETEGIAKEKPVIKIGYLPVTHHLPLAVADTLNKDKYQNFELELVKFSSWPELTEALNSGQIQGAMHMLELAMLSSERGIPGEILSLGHRNGDSFYSSP